MRARSLSYAAIRALLVMLVALGLAAVVGAEAAAYALPLLAVLAATVGGRYAGAERLLALAERIAARRDQRRVSASRVPSRWWERPRVAVWREAHRVRAPRAPPAFLAA